MRGLPHNLAANCWPSDGRLTQQVGPTEGIQFGFSQQVMATGYGNSLIVYSEPLLPTKTLPWNATYGAGGRPNGAFCSGNLQLGSDELPVWVQKLEWQGDVVAVPRHSSFSALPTAPRVLDSWAQTQGAAHIWKRFPILLNASKLNPIQKCALESVNAQNAASGADTCVTVQWKNAKRQVSRRLEAFDGKTRRVLWIENAAHRNRYWKSEQTQGFLPGAVANNSLLFRLRDVPASWGKITFFIDAIFDPRLNAGSGVTSCDAQTIQKLKSRGWIPFSRQLTVRAKSN